MTYYLFLTIILLVLLTICFWCLFLSYIYRELLKPALMKPEFSYLTVRFDKLPGTIVLLSSLLGFWDGCFGRKFRQSLGLRRASDVISLELLLKSVGDLSCDAPVMRKGLWEWIERCFEGNALNKGISTRRMKWQIIMSHEFAIKSWCGNSNKWADRKFVDMRGSSNHPSHRFLSDQTPGASSQ